MRIFTKNKEAENEECDSMNIFSDIKDGIAYVVGHYHVDEKQEKLMIEKTDSERKMCGIDCKCSKINRMVK